MGWSFSTTGVGAFSKCNATTSGCGGACTTDPGGGTSIPSGVTLLGRPSLASDGVGHVVYVSPATDKKKGQANLVVAAMSTDGGMSFENAVIVNDNQCSNGVQDLPYATFDTTTSPATLWIVWRHKGAGTFGGCVRHGILDLASGPPDACGTPTPQITWLGRNFGQAESVNGMDHDFGVGANSQGGLMIQAGDGAATVVYSGNDQLPSFCSTTTPTRMSWGSVTTFDGGQNWTSSSPSFFITSNAYRWCVLDNKSTDTTNDTPSFTTGLRDFGFTRASNGRYYAAVHDSRSTIRIFESADKGGHWREFCPAHVGEPLGAGTGENQLSPWRPTSSPCPSAAVDASMIELSPPPNGSFADLSLAWPTIAADGDVWAAPAAPFPGVVNLAQNGQHKSRFVLSFLEGSMPNGAGNFDNQFSAVAMFDTDPISPNADAKGTLPANDVLQPPTPTDPNSKLQTSPPGASLGVMGPGNTDYGDCMSIALQYSSACGEGFDAKTGVASMSNCALSTAWPFWPNATPSNGAVGLDDVSAGGTN